MLPELQFRSASVGCCWSSSRPPRKSLHFIGKRRNSSVPLGYLETSSIYETPCPSARMALHHCEICIIMTIYPQPSYWLSTWTKKSYCFFSCIFLLQLLAFEGNGKNTAFIFQHLRFLGFFFCKTYIFFVEAHAILRRVIDRAAHVYSIFQHLSE